MPYQACNPYTQELGPVYPDLTKEELLEVLEETSEAQKGWAKLSIGERAGCLVSLAGVLRAQVERLATLATWEMGKHIRESKAEVEKCAACCDYFASLGPAGLESIPINLAGGAAGEIGFRPLGTILAVMPWNFPYWQVIRAAVPALLAGNAIVLKHAESVPGCALALEGLFAEAGFPKGVFRNVFMPHSLTEVALAHSSIAALTLTGSERAGQEVGMLAAKYLKKSVLELGGSDAFVVLADADIELAAQKAAEARMLNNGQSCVAAKRFIIEEHVYERFAELFCTHLASYSLGNPMEDALDYGPLVHKNAAMHLQKQVDRSIELGARVKLAGGHRAGAFFYPVVLEGVTPGMPAFDEEFFGPAATLLRATNAADALRLANASPYGLGGSIWTKNVEAGRAFACEMETGSVYLNAVMKSDPMLPFGGIKKSGHGRELSVFGLREFVNTLCVVG